jgi:hypothetical protein
VTTSKRVARDASQQLRDKKNPKKVREVAGSDLRQAKKPNRKS